MIFIIIITIIQKLSTKIDPAVGYCVYIPKCISLAHYQNKIFLQFYQTRHVKTSAFGENLYYKLKIFI